MLPELWEHCLGSWESIWLLVWADWPSGNTDCQSVHGQRCLFSHLAEPETYQIVVGIKWDTFLLCFQNLAHFAMTCGSNHTMPYPGNSTFMFAIITPAFIVRDNIELTWCTMCTTDQIQNRSIDNHVLRRIQLYMYLLVCM